MAWIKSNAYIARCCFLLIGFVTADAIVCSNGWSRYDGRCYKLIGTLYTFSEAVSECQRQNALSYPAVSNDVEENTFLHGLSPGRIWLGCDATRGDYIWRCPDESMKTYDANSQTANPLNSYWNWEITQDEPSNSDECQVLYQDPAKWYSWPCTPSFQTVCEVDPEMLPSDFVPKYEFVFTYLQPQHDEMEGSFAYLLITTTSVSPGQVTVKIPGIQIFEKVMVSHRVLANISLPTSVYLTGSGKQNKTIIIRSEVEISVQAMYIYTYYRSTGFSVQPTTLLGKEYFVSSYHPYDSSEKSEFSITALAQRTNITINFGGTALIHAPLNIILVPYESYQYQSNDDLTGVQILASRPVSVMSGATAVRLVATSGGPEYMIQNLPPVKNMGTRYVLAPFRERTSGYIYRIIATKEQTVVTLPSYVPLDRGSFHEATINGNDVVTISANNPVLVTQFPKSHHTDAKGDTFMLIIPPITEIEMGEISFPVTNLSTKSAQRTFISVTIACQDADALILDTQHGAIGWDRLEASVDGIAYCVMRHQVPSGVHKIGVATPTIPYNAMVYGFGDLYVAYAFSLFRLPPPTPSKDRSSSEATSITCDSRMVVYLNSTYVEPGHSNDVHLADPSCTGEIYANNTIRIATDFNSCGTEMTINEDNMIFRNKLLYKAPRGENIFIGNTSTPRFFDLNIDLTCTVPRRGNSSLGHFVGPIKADEAGFGHIRFSLAMYNDATYGYAYKSDEFPVMIEEGEPIFLAASIVNVKNVRMSVESCRVTPSRNPDDAVKHTILENGCGTDHPVTFYDSKTTTEQRFSIPMYSFIDNQPKMYIHCDMIVCGVNDTASCPPINNDCPPRVPRDTASKHSTSPLDEKIVTISTAGSFQIKKPTYDTPKKHDSTKMGITLAAVGGISLCAVVFILLGLALKKRMSSHPSYSTGELEMTEMNDVKI